jgi:hypothetical protein
MSIRPVEFFDLPLVYRFRADVAGLDATRLLTRGNPLGAAGLLASMNPARNMYAAIADANGSSVLGAVMQTRGDAFARLLYLAPRSNLLHPELPVLLDALAAEAGSWGAFHILAEAVENGEAFVPLRNAGFSVYAWQRMWDVSNIAPIAGKSDWHRLTSGPPPAVQSLLQQIVPPLLHAVEPLPREGIGWMSGDAATCYVVVQHGVHGVVLAPLIHPEAADVGARLSSLIAQLAGRRNRAVYLCVRSYQAWLEPVLEDLGATAAARQAVMVKHLARLVKGEQPVKVVQPAGVSVQPSRLETKEQ